MLPKINLISKKYRNGLTNYDKQLIKKTIYSVPQQALIFLVKNREKLET
ncbi:hypothetical protein CY0110_16587 [Crocosphaera chwakensis CCY0110]|uniref:Uncharacterized protein n=1 Tax=Crocosphaera chwakensis CCY0110 TaxID=391612 RepID=A3IHZ9_9CHRO|nr:hypothetical protein CY0110_16587 [Crocosphaera chwakensis CCY0110]